MIITESTRVSDILKNYGDIAPYMNQMGVKSLAPYFLRRFIARFITVRQAAFLHGLDLHFLIDQLNRAVREIENKRSLK